MVLRFHFSFQKLQKFSYYLHSFKRVGVELDRHRDHKNVKLKCLENGF